MPTYTYQCQRCGNTFDEILPIARMHEPEQGNCSKCGGEIKKIITPVTVSYAGAPRVIPDWFNDNLKRIKERYGSQKTTVDDHIKR